MTSLPCHVAHGLTLPLPYHVAHELMVSLWHNVAYELIMSPPWHVTYVLMMSLPCHAVHGLYCLVSWPMGSSSPFHLSISPSPMVPVWLPDLPAHVFQVNGLFVKLPAQVSNTVSLNESQGSITITQVSGVQVTFSPEGKVTIIARENLTNKLCAPCGDFNDNVSDDLRLPSGRVVGTIAEVIDAWKARDFTGW